MKIGIFFGGGSREREISFAGGRTVYDNLDKGLFEPVPIFVTPTGQFVLLDWQYLYKGSIRDFYPPTQFLPKNFHDIQVYADSLTHLSESEQLEMASAIGKVILPTDLPKEIDFAFLALHGAMGEDGSIQGLLEYLNVPFSGSGILPSAIGMSKSFQKELLKGKGYSDTRFLSIKRADWKVDNHRKIYEDLQEKVGVPLVIRPANQGSSIGVGMLMEDDFDHFIKITDCAFFIEKLRAADWHNLAEADKIQWLKDRCDLRSHLGLPVEINNQFYATPETLLIGIETAFEAGKTEITLKATNSESEVLAEEFINGREFSCIVVRNEAGKSVALPPTEIIKGKEIYDYRSKYLPGLSRKETPIDLSDNEVERIRQSAIELFEFLRFDVYARIDGFYCSDGRIVLNDPNTTSGMLPSSFFFHQAAEIGLNPSRFLSFLIRQSIAERLKGQPQKKSYSKLLHQLDQQIEATQNAEAVKTKVAVVMGGYSSERHISVESGRNIYEKLASSVDYEPTPVFLTGKQGDWHLHQIPINLMLKDNADDISSKLSGKSRVHPLLEKIRKESLDITQKYGQAAGFASKEISINDLKDQFDFVFIALHGRPGEDGELQILLDKENIPYNGSPVVSSAITINKYKTNQLLDRLGFSISPQLLVRKEKWRKNTSQLLSEIELQFAYPFITKPHDDGCSSAVKLIKNRAQLAAFGEMIFREEMEVSKEIVETLNLKLKEEIPIKDCFLIEEFTQRKNAKHFLEVTGGLLTHYDEKGELVYEMFEASETLSATEILSLEEKFLAGEGQNLTPARYAPDPIESQRISDLVKKDLERVARALKIEGYTRIDAFVRIYEDQTIDTIVIEANSLPGMTPATAIFHQAALNNYKPYEFIEKIIQFGQERTLKH